MLAVILPLLSSYFVLLPEKLPLIFLEIFVLVFNSSCSWLLARVFLSKCWFSKYCENSLLRKM